MSFKMLLLWIKGNNQVVKMYYEYIPNWVACICIFLKHHRGLERLYINETYYSYPEASAVISQCLSFTLSPACTNFLFFFFTTVFV